MCCEKDIKNDDLDVLFLHNRNRMYLIRRKISKTWLDSILRGKRQFMLNKGFWATLKKGECFVAFNDQNEIILEVTEILQFKDFGQVRFQATF